MKYVLFLSEDGRAKETSEFFNRNNRSPKISSTFSNAMPIKIGKEIEKIVSIGVDVHDIKKEVLYFPKDISQKELRYKIVDLMKILNKDSHCNLC